MLITPDQIRAARALKGWSQGELANRTGLAVPTIANIEISKQDPSAKTLDKIIKAFSLGGINFTDKGVEKSDNTISYIHGYYNYYMILQDALSSLKKGDEMLLLASDSKRSPPEVVDLHEKLEKSGIIIKEIICEGNPFIQGDHRNIRAMPKKYFTYKDVISIYGNKVVSILPQGGIKDADLIVVVENKFIADNHREIFKFFWDHSTPIKDWVMVQEFKQPMLLHYSEKELQDISNKHKKKKAGK